MGFTEFFVIIVVGLIVIGPEKLPEAIRSALVWLGRIKRVISDTRSEFEQQLGMDDIRRQIHNDEVMASLEQLKSTKRQMQQESAQLTQQVNTLTKDIREDFPNDDALFGEQQAQHPANRSDVADAAPASESPATNIHAVSSSIDSSVETVHAKSPVR